MYIFISIKYRCFQTENFRSTVDLFDVQSGIQMFCSEFLPFNFEWLPGGLNLTTDIIPSNIYCSSSLHCPVLIRWSSDNCQQCGTPCEERTVALYPWSGQRNEKNFAKCLVSMTVSYDIMRITYSPFPKKKKREKVTTYAHTYVFVSRSQILFP